MARQCGEREKFTGERDSSADTGCIRTEVFPEAADPNRPVPQLPVTVVAHAHNILALYPFLPPQGETIGMFQNWSLQQLFYR